MSPRKKPVTAKRRRVTDLDRRTEGRGEKEKQPRINGVVRGNKRIEIAETLEISNIRNR
jgi:hypothetical protein